MPLHDWNTVQGWDGVHLLWISELLRHIKPRLPAGYRAYVGSAPLIALSEPEGKADLSVRQFPQTPPPNGGPSEASPKTEEEPDVEVAVATLDPTRSLFISREGWLVAAVELISPRNKDRPSSRTHYLSRYASYLMGGVHLLLVDVHPRPYGFSFADELARDFQIDQPRLPTPMAVSYRVGEEAPDGGRFLALWRRPLTVESALPTVPVALTVSDSVKVDLEETYMHAAVDAYLS
jgi:hypothetical protein